MLTEQREARKAASRQCQAFRQADFLDRFSTSAATFRSDWQIRAAMAAKGNRKRRLLQTSPTTRPHRNHAAVASRRPNGERGRGSSGSVRVPNAGRGDSPRNIDPDRLRSFDPHDTALVCSSSFSLPSLWSNSTMSRVNSAFCVPSYPRRDRISWCARRAIRAGCSTSRRKRNHGQALTDIPGKEVSYLQSPTRLAALTKSIDTMRTPSSTCSRVRS